MIKQNIIIFDGVCNFCNAAVNFIVKRDCEKKFLFSSMQNEKSKELLAQFSIDNSDLDTLIVIKNDTLFIKSDAVLEIVKEFSGFWFILSYCKIIPKPIRDFIYTLISRNRYKLFGKKESCFIPTKEQQERFLV